MNTLITTHAEPQFLPRIIFDPSEVVCGPWYNNSDHDGNPRFRHTPFRNFDYEQIRSRLPGNWSPSLILVHVDASLNCLPENLPEHAKKVLLIGDTHHLNQPIQNLLNYARSGTWDAIVCWNRQHAHFFCEAGLQNVAWIPGLIFDTPVGEGEVERRNQICFFGQIGPYHPRRQRLIEAVQKAKLPLVGGKLPRHESIQLVRSSLISLNPTLNGEFNLRVFETLRNGTLLLMDRLSPQTGLESFFPDEECLVTFDNADDLIEKARYYLAHPEKARNIAEKGKAVANRYFSFQARKEALLSLVEGKPTLDLFHLHGENRCLLPKVETSTAELFSRRLKAYEFLQEIHRKQESLHVIHTSGVSLLYPSDFADLARLRQSLAIEKNTFKDSWSPAIEELGIQNLRQISPDSLPEQTADILVTALDDLGQNGTKVAIRDHHLGAILIHDLTDDERSAVETELSSVGYTSQYAFLPGLFTLGKPDN